MADIFSVVISEGAFKQLSKMPGNIIVKLEAWIEDVGNRAYRAIYKIDKNGVVEFIEILEVNKHEYKK